jgi:hypothetical protein
MSEYNEDAYREARLSVNPTPCAFEKGVLARCIERETVNCSDAVAQARCISLKFLLRNQSAFALRITSTNAPLPHAKELRIQCGGLRGLQQTMDGLGEVTDAVALIDAALSRYGALETLPFSEIVQGVVHFAARRRGV